MSDIDIRKYIIDNFKDDNIDKIRNSIDRGIFFEVDYKVTDEELAIGAQRLIEYYYTQAWDGKLPDTFVGDGDISNIIVGTN